MSRPKPQVRTLQPRMGTIEVGRPIGTLSPSPAYRSWYKTARWQKLRAAQLQREPLCRMCKSRITVATVCDHITPHRGDPILFWNGPFQSLCVNHHSSAKQRLERGGKQRGCDESGIPHGGGWSNKGSEP